MIRTVSALALAFCLSGSALAAPAADTVMRSANLRPASGSPEAGLWQASDEAETYARQSADLDSDPVLGAYVRNLICKLAPEYCGELRILVMTRPVLNATAAPNGYVEVYSGLMLRSRTESELAYVLGHEISHFARNHALAQWQRNKTRGNVTLAIQVGVSVVAIAAMASVANSGDFYAPNKIDYIGDAAQTLSDLAYIHGLATYFAYSREDESEADRLGQIRAHGVGYDPWAAPAIWQSVGAEVRASEYPEVRKSLARATIFDTHPLTEDRIEALKRAAGSTPHQTAEESRAEEQAYRAIIRPHLAVWLRDDLRRRDLGQSLHLISRLEAVGEDLGLLAYYRGEAYRQRHRDGDLSSALAAYRLSITHADAPAEAWRELGEAESRAGNAPAAIRALETYLTRAPGSEDRWLIESELETLKASHS